MLDWLEELWARGEAFEKGLAITLSGEEGYIIEGYFAAMYGNVENPYSDKKAEWWRRGQQNYQNGPPA